MPMLHQPIFLKPFSIARLVRSAGLVLLLYRSVKHAVHSDLRQLCANNPTRWF